MSTFVGTGEIQSLKDEVIRVIDKFKPKLVDLSRSIFSEPELKFEEYKTAEKLTAALRGIEGVSIEKGVAGCKGEGYLPALRAYWAKAA